MKANPLIDKIVVAAAIILMLAIGLLIFISPPGLLDVQSVYQIF
jgi:hypothetical protein